MDTENATADDAQAQGDAFNGKLVKKISSKALGFNKPELQKMVLANQANNNFIYRVWGRAEGFIQGSSKFARGDGGDDAPRGWTGLTGDFRAITRDGEPFESVVCFLPEYVIGGIKNALTETDSEGVEFAFDVYAQYDEAAATSYVFVCKPLRRTESIAAAERMSRNFPALPSAPKLAQIAGPKGGKK